MIIKNCSADQLVSYHAVNLLDIRKVLLVKPLIFEYLFYILLTNELRVINDSIERAVLLKSINKNYN